MTPAHGSTELAEVRDAPLVFLVIWFVSFV
jgi:hypothetical protein